MRNVLRFFFFFLHNDNTLEFGTYRGSKLGKITGNPEFIFTESTEKCTYLSLNGTRSPFPFNSSITHHL
jgi:hypothetical protein